MLSVIENRTIPVRFHFEVEHDYDFDQKEIVICILNLFTIRWRFKHVNSSEDLYFWVCFLKNITHIYTLLDFK